MSKPAATITDFFSGQSDLDDLITRCDIDGVGLIVGPYRSFQPDSVKYSQKVKLFNHIRKLRSDIIILDCGSGTHFNIIDMFLLADKKIVVTLPQITALENMYAFFRRLTRVFVENKLKYVIENAVKKRQEYKLGNLRQFVSFLEEVSDLTKEIVERELTTYRVSIIINQVRTSKDIDLGSSIKSVCIKYLGFNSKYAGYVEFDETISMAFNKQQSYLQIYPKSRCAEKIERIVDNLLKDTQMRVQL